MELSPGAGNVIAGGRLRCLSGRRLDCQRFNRDSNSGKPDRHFGRRQTGSPNISGIYVDGYEGTATKRAEHVNDLLIGGTDPGAGNLISGQQTGIYVRGPNAINVTIQGNKIGTDIDGQSAIGNGTGILLEDASGVVVGGSEPGAGNLISGNTGDGIAINGTATSTKSESFIATYTAPLNGWTEFGNRDNRNSYGFSPTNLTGPIDESGFEAGGTFARASTTLGETSPIPISYYADTHLGGSLTLDDRLHADGQLNVTESDVWNNNVYVAHFGRDDAEANLRRNVIGLAVIEPDAGLGSEGIRLAAYMLLSSGPEIIGGWVNAPIGLDFGVPYTWRYDYDPDGGNLGAGQLVVEIFAEGTSLGTSQISLTEAQRNVGASFDAFGLKTGGNPGRSNNPNTVTLYIDELNYSRPSGQNIIQGNFIGTTADGGAALPNAGGMDLYQSSGNLIVGNLVSGNSVLGIQLRAGSDNNLIQGNKVGTDITGTLSVPNTVMGIDVIVDASGNIIGTDGDGNQRRERRQLDLGQHRSRDPHSRAEFGHAHRQRDRRQPDRCRCDREYTASQRLRHPSLGRAGNSNR